MTPRRRALILLTATQRAAAVAADFDARLAARRVGRAERNARSKRSAITKQRKAYENDALLWGQVPL